MCEKKKEKWQVAMSGKDQAVIDLFLTIVERSGSEIEIECCLEDGQRLRVKK